MRRLAWIALAACVALPSTALADGPLLTGSPWPEMRHDMRNTASSPIVGRYRGDKPWSFTTQRGIFSTPVIGADGTVYVGSADTSFYALAPDGSKRWRFETGGIIDAAAALGAGPKNDFPITIGSGDETLYQLRSKDKVANRVRWTYRSPLTPATGQLVNWWEGNPAYGPDGNLYVGNTGGGVYSLTPGGEQRWITQRANSVWTTPAFDAEGNSYWGSVDFFAFSLDPAGQLRWETFTPGYLTSSPALGSDGTVYIGSFDRSLHALDPATGAERWAFPTADHIYSSPALAADEAGNTTAIYIGSADGSIYAVRPDGTRIWSYDTGDPVRSSPVVGRAPNGKRVVYVGSSNGVLYALDAATGKRRWSFDTTPNDPELADRNDLNGSPALGKRGVYISGEHGRVWFVPYDLCRHSEGKRCTTDPGPEFKPTVTRMFAVTPGGTTLRGSTEHVPAATALASRLVVRRNGETIDAAIDPAFSVKSKPSFTFSTELSGDGHFLFIRPDGILKPDTDYKVSIAGAWTADGANGTFSKTLHYVTGPLRHKHTSPAIPIDSVQAIELSRLALPEPSLLPSVNQIGFDSYDLVAGILDSDAYGGGTRLMWVIGGKTNKNGKTVADPNGGFAFPLYGSSRANQVALNTSQVSLQFSFGPVPLRSMDFRGATRLDGSFKPGASLYGQVNCADVPNYSAQLRIAGVCNASDTLASYGTFLSDPYDGPANAKPKRVKAAGVEFTAPTATEDGSAVASLRVRDGTRYPAAKHLVSVLLVDAATGAPVSLDYRTLTEQVVDGAGNVVGARLTIPAGMQLPPEVSAYTIADVYPLGSTNLTP